MLGTANTMSCMAEVLGFTVPGCAATHAVYSRKLRQAKQSGMMVVDLVKKDLKPRDIATSDSFHNAVTVAMASAVPPTLFCIFRQLPRV